MDKVFCYTRLRKNKNFMLITNIYEWLSFLERFTKHKKICNLYIEDNINN